jgi:hypothetical protein
MLHLVRLSIFPILLPLGVSSGLVAADAPHIALAQAANAIVPVASPPPSAHEVFGTIAGINGTLLTVQTRAGLIQVDDASALKNHLSVPPVIGRAVTIAGNYDAAGILHATVMLRAKSSPLLWDPDS